MSLVVGAILVLVFVTLGIRDRLHEGEGPTEGHGEIHPSPGLGGLDTVGLDTVGVDSGGLPRSHVWA